MPDPTDVQQEEARRLLEEAFSPIAIPPTAGGPVVDLLATVIAERDAARDEAKRTDEGGTAALADLRERAALLFDWTWLCLDHGGEEAEKIAAMIRALPLRREP